ncbi:MAG: SdpI family protein [Nitrospirae bacterium]|nr:SdpI family protein [Nitrospirota bacterium]
MPTQPFLIPSLLILIASIPLAMGVVPRNRVYGIRTCKTLSDDSIWYPANRLGGRALIISCIIYLSISVLIPYDVHTQSNSSVWTIHFISFLLPLAAGIIVTLLYVRKL